MLARRQELNTRLQVLIDAFLLALPLWAAYALRYYSTFWFNLSKSVDPQSNYAWLLIPIMAFGPILLDLQGFYQSPLIGNGRGPTKLMSPISTFRSCGSSSKLVRRSQPPNRVTRGSDSTYYI